MFNRRLTLALRLGGRVAGDLVAKSRGDDAEDRSQDLLRGGERAVRRWLHARRILGERDEALVATATGRDRNLSFPADDLPPVNQMNLPEVPSEDVF